MVGVSTVGVGSTMNMFSIFSVPDTHGTCVCVYMAVMDVI